MLYVGLDVHSKSIAICVLDENGKVTQRQCVRRVDQLLAFLERLPAFAVCYEASCGYGPLYEELSRLANRVVVAHPGRLRLIFRSKRKNDRVDAKRLATLLFLDELPQVHVPPEHVRAWRELINFRRQLIGKRTRAKNGVRALLRSVGLQPPARPGLWSKQGMAWLKGLQFSQPLHAVKRDLLVEEIEALSAQIRRLEGELKRFSEHNPAIRQLRSIPGVGLRTAEAMVAFLDDPLRFPHCKKIGAYFGLIPCQDQSAGTNRLGHITREGAPVVRQMLVEAVWQAVRRSPTVRAYFERIRRNDPGRKKIAVVATAHYLARVMWAMLRDGSEWEESIQGAEPKAA